jgi:hypothetical protein
MAILLSWRGYVSGLVFSKRDNALRHWTATITHLQLTIGLLLYLHSPIVQFFWKYKDVNSPTFEATFYSLIHALLMFFAIIVVTIGSAKAKRMSTDKEKFRTVLLWFSLSFLIILVAIPWPFSPLANRPLIRPI